MRILLLALVLCLPMTALADPCPQGSNVPLTSDTRSTNNQQPQGVAAPQGNTGFGSTQAQRTAYPH